MTLPVETYLMLRESGFPQDFKHDDPVYVKRGDLDWFAAKWNAYYHKDCECVSIPVGFQLLDFARELAEKRFEGFAYLTFTYSGTTKRTMVEVENLDGFIVVETVWCESDIAALVALIEQILKQKEVK